MPTEENIMERNVEFLLVTDGEARLRTGARRTEKEARTLLKEIAEGVGLEVTTAKGDGFIKATVKE